ncbi:MAG: diguanylate cyclase [Defluviitaleaceae bacterium]|nr:diguanylate cyclase [Defluviitaleaceae bacterium]
METKNRILVVEDSKISIMHLVQILRDDYDLLIANNGTEAIEMAKEHKPDLILLDIIMPELDGYETLELLKVSSRTRDIPVIFISSLDEESDEERGLSLGAADYITKPFSPVIVKLRVLLQIRISNQLKTIQRLSMMDHLINIPNRKYFDRRLHEEWDRAYRNNVSIGLMIADIDRFKEYNDIHGHKQGDGALIAVANTITGFLNRPGDFAARWGGKSFAVLMPETDLIGVKNVSERIRKATEKRSIPNPAGEHTFVTVSIGASVGLPPSKNALDKFISYADAALNRAKESGRNRIEIHEYAVEPEE